MRLLKRSLMSRLVGSFLVLMLVTVSLVSSVAFVQARAALEQSAFDQLEVVAALKTDEINRWIEEQRNFIEFLVRSGEVRNNARLLTSPDNLHQVTAYRFLTNFLQSAADSHPDLQEIFILSLDSEIILSTHLANEGIYQVNATYFTQGQHETFVQNVYPSPITALPTITIATPMLDETGSRRGVLAAHLNLERLDSIILERNGLGETGESYLVDQFNSFVAGERSIREEFKRGVRTEGINAAVDGRDGAGLYDNYAGVPVVGVYTWIAERDLALLVELPQAEAFAPARQLAGSIVLVGVVCTLVLSAGVYVVARQIVYPVEALSITATQVAAGDLDQKVLVQTQDEVGMLAHSFNRMTMRLKKLYEDLQRSEEHFRSLIENSSDVITIVNRDGIVLYESPSVETVLGYAEGTIRDRLLTEFIHPDDIPVLLDALEHSFANTDHTLEAEFRFRHAGGSWRILEGRGQHLQDISGEAGIVINARDITLRRRAEEDRARLQEENLRARSEFIATVSHELRTPLTPIRGYVDVLLMGAGGEVSEQQREFLQTIKENTMRMRSLVDDLLDVGRLETGKIALNYDTMNLGPLIRHEVKLMQAELDRKQMQLILDIPDDLPNIQADNKRVSQVFVNLFSNAIKYTFAQGTIWVRVQVQQPDGCMVVEVEDTGVGLTPEQQEKLFTPFYRADNPLLTEAGGTGLGLTIAKSFIELHGGSITVRSQQGVGSTFAFSLPLKRTTLPAPANVSPLDGDGQSDGAELPAEPYDTPSSPGVYANT